MQSITKKNVGLPFDNFGMTNLSAIWGDSFGADESSPLSHDS